MNRHSHRFHGAGGRAFCLLFAVLAAIGWLVCAGAEAGPLNASGNRNLPLSVDPARNTEGYSAILYDNRNGLPTSEANAIAQTEDGFLWIGSYAGLIRYDGDSFERVESPDGIPNTRCLYVDSQGRLWIGTNDFGIFLRSGSSLSRVDQPHQLVSVSIRSMAEDGNGLIYIGTAAGVATVDKDLTLRVVEDDRLNAVTIQDLRLGGDGLIYGLTSGGDLFAMRDGWMTGWLSHEACGCSSFLALLPDFSEPGALYLAVEDAGTSSAHILHGSPADSLASAEVIDAAPLSGVERMEAIDGAIWICANNGIGKLDAEGVHQLKNMPMENLVGHVMTDHEGNLWFTSTRECVMKIVPNRFLDCFEQYGIPADIVNSTCMLDGRLFIGTDDSGLMVLEDGRLLDTLPLTSASTASGKPLAVDDLLDYLKEERVRSIIRDSRDRLWISTWRHGHGLVCYDHGALTAFTQEDGLLSAKVRTVSETEDGSILVAQPDGMSVIRDMRVTASYGAQEGLVVTSVLTLTEGFQHEYLLGSDGGGIYVIDEGGVRCIGLEDGLKSEVILRIKRSHVRDVYWIATGNSIAFMTPDHRVTTVENFPYSNNYDFYESSRGDLWVLSSNGIYVVPADDLLANGEIDAVFCGVPSGLPYIATSNAFSELTADGELYIAGVKGVIRVNIEDPLDSISKLKIALPSIDVDGERVYPDQEGVFHLPYSTRRLTIHPYIFNYSLMDPDVSWRLEGFDAADTVVPRSDLAPAVYTNLRQGSYRFVVRAEDPIGASSVSAAYTIVKQRSLSDSAAGSIIMDLTSLFLLSCIMLYSSMQRKRGLTDDRLYFSAVICCIVLAVSEAGSYLLENKTGAYTREIVYLTNLVFYATLETFPYLFLLYLEHRTFPDRLRLRRLGLVYLIPIVLTYIFLIVSLPFGWVFSINAVNGYVAGPWHHVIYLPVAFYFLIALFRVYRINPRLLALGIVLIISRIIWAVWYYGISSTVFVYTLLLLSAYIETMNYSVFREGKA